MAFTGGSLIDPQTVITYQSHQLGLCQDATDEHAPVDISISDFSSAFVFALRYFGNLLSSVLLRNLHNYFTEIAVARYPHLTPKKTNHN